MGEGHVEALAGLDRQAHTDQPGAGDVERGGLGVECEEAQVDRTGEDAVELVECGDGDRTLLALLAALGAVLGRRRGDLADAGGQGLEAVGVEELEQRLGVEGLAAQLVQAQRQGGVGVEADQAVGEPRLVGVQGQHLAALGLLDLVEVGEQAFERAVFGQELGRTLGADAGHAGHVVGGVADECQRVADQLGADAELLDHLGPPDGLLLHRVPHGDPVGHELHQVLVRGDDGDGLAGFPRLLGVGGDQVVGLEALDVDDRQAEGAGGLAHQLELGDELRWEPPRGWPCTGRRAGS